MMASRAHSAGNVDGVERFEELDEFEINDFESLDFFESIESLAPVP